MSSNSSSIGETEVIIFLSCVGGVLGFVFIVAFLGFCWEHCKKSKARSNRKRRNEKHSPNNSKPPVTVNTITQASSNHGHSCVNHYPTWMYDTMISEKVMSMKNYLENGGNDQRKSLSQDPVHYINEVFSDIYEEEDDPIKDRELAIGYEKANKMIKPERKPALPVPYYKYETSQNKNEEPKEKLKISLESEFVEPHKEIKSAGKMVPFDDIDLDLFEMDDSGSEKEPIKVMIPKNLTVGEKIKARKHQIVEYENPTILEKERREKRKEEEETERRRAKRIAMDMEMGFTFHPETMSDNVFAPPKKRIPEKEPVFNSVTENQTKDSFLY